MNAPLAFLYIYGVLCFDLLYPASRCVARIVDERNYTYTCSSQLSTLNPKPEHLNPNP